jgi:hypothetical protein
MLGEVVYKKDIEGFSKTNNVDLAFLPKGIYLLTIMNGENKAVRKIVKQ